MKKILLLTLSSIFILFLNKLGDDDDVNIRSLQCTFLLKLELHYNCGFIVGGKGDESELQMNERARLAIGG